MLSRKVVTRRGRKFRGRFPSLKMGQMVPWESLLERDAILLFEFSPGVETFRAQPEEVLYIDGEITRRYYPDFEIVGRSGRVTHLEVKPEAILGWGKKPFAELGTRVSTAVAYRTVIPLVLKAGGA